MPTGGSSVSFSLVDLVSRISSNPSIYVYEGTTTSADCSPALWYLYNPSIYVPSYVVSNFISLYDSMAPTGFEQSVISASADTYGNFRPSFAMSNTSGIVRFCW